MSAGQTATSMPQKFFDTYFSYIGDTEAPMTFHRWAILSCAGAAIARRAYIPLGHFKIYPTLYVMLVGSSGTRKSVSINLAKDLLKRANYYDFAADKTTKEKFIADLMEKNYSVKGLVELNDVKVDNTDHRAAEMFIVSDEFQDFLGINNLDFITLLGRLWEGRDGYEHRIKNGKSSTIYLPTVGILGGNTPTGFSLTFPPEIVGQGFLSRLLLIYGDITEKRISWPRPTDRGMGLVVSNKLKSLINLPATTFDVTISARELLADIYQAHVRVDDPRFASYETRRHDHLLKVTAIMCALGDRTTVEKNDVLAANTVLYYAERKMPLALGEFGKGKFSDVGSSIMEALIKSRTPLSLNDLWRIVAQDLNSQNDLVGVLRGLQTLDKVQTVEVDNAIKFLPKRQVIDYADNKYVLEGFLTPEEAVG